ncbi:DNA-3-methyladenine glycosylase [Chitinophaga sp. Cy-1792]|uniref:DNA-3-methyladenine glycosylase family protein n=1 Tax=Chitinophaga sp. Cy-1792 TaxID=2608339 RepID=UPI00141D7DE2|nr:DNA-3-methyladenine glycosylase 2 [Chitinophaga sp. Cy-1792]NIG54848.1 DNA-3-methyladenine glycosylase 2 [Chitinophaga sp. Cy-1792]
MKCQEIFVAINNPENFSFQECLRFLGRSDKEILHFIREDRLQRLVAVDDGIALITVSAGDRQQLRVEVLPVALTPGDEPGQISEEGLQYIRRYVSHWLDLDANLESFYKFAAKNPLLKGLPEQYKGLRLVGIPELFEAICWTIIGQQINLAFAYTLRQRLITEFGYSLDVAGNTYHLFPQPEVIAALTPEMLTPLQFSRSKAAYLIYVANAMVKGELSAAALLQQDYAAARESLIALKGIGNWSANYILMKYRRFPEALPLEDAGLHNAIRFRLQLPAKPTPAQLQELTGVWKEHAAYATFYLWRTLLPQ